MPAAIVVTARATVLNIVWLLVMGCSLLLCFGGDGRTAFPQPEIVANRSFLDCG